MYAWNFDVKLGLKDVSYLLRSILPFGILFHQLCDFSLMGMVNASAQGDQLSAQIHHFSQITNSVRQCLG